MFKIDQLKSLLKGTMSQKNIDELVGDVTPLYEFHEFISKKYSIDDKEVESKFKNFLQTKSNEIKKENYLEKMPEILVEYAKLEGYVNPEPLSKAIKSILSLGFLDK